MSGRKRAKRLCIFAHFDKDNIVDQYVLFYLQDIRKVADRVVFVSTSSLAQETISALMTVCDAVLIRKNEGYDFASWKLALQSETLHDFDELILCNDSVYGPFFPLEQIFCEMEEVTCDFWGMTSNYDIAYHVQSYFLVFRKAVLVSSAFRQFWERMETQQSKKGAIKLGEIRLSQTLLKAGFKNSTYTRHRLLLGLAFFFSLHFYVAKTGLRIMTYVRVLGLRLFRGRRKDHRQRSLAMLIKLAILSVESLFSEIREASGNGLYKMLEFIRHPGKKLRRLGIWFEVRIKAVNVTHFLWKQLVLYYKMPFIKVDLLRDNPMGINIDNFAAIISRVSNYNVLMITDHLSRARKGPGEV